MCSEDRSEVLTAIAMMIINIKDCDTVGSTLLEIFRCNSDVVEVAITSAEGLLRMMTWWSSVLEHEVTPSRSVVEDRQLTQVQRCRWIGLDHRQPMPSLHTA